MMKSNIGKESMLLKSKGKKLFSLKNIVDISTREKKLFSSVEKLFNRIVKNGRRLFRKNG